MNYLLPVISLIGILSFQVAAAKPGVGVVINEDGWGVEVDLEVTRPMSALIRPEDGLIYFGRRDRSGQLSRADFLGNSEQLVGADSIGGVGYDPQTGALFFSEDFPGDIKRVDIDPDTGVASSQDWVTGFHPSDDDPTGITVVPLDYTGPLLAPGDMVSTDRGFNGPKMIYTWSPVTPENEILVHDNDGSLVDPVDIAIKGQIIAIADDEEGIKLLNEDSTASPLATVGGSFAATQGVVFDTRSDHLLVLDTELDGVYRVDVGSGEATPMFSQLGTSGTNWGGINIYDDGTTQRIVVSVTNANRVLVFSGPDGLFEDRFEDLR